MDKVKGTDTIELVVARYNENLDWLKLLPKNVKVTVYNKGNDDIDVPFIRLPNVGRESGTYLHHIIENYKTSSFSHTTVFCQGDSLFHSPDFIELIKHAHLFEPVQPLSAWYWPEGEPPHFFSNPPKVVLEHSSSKKAWLDHKYRVHVEYMDKNFATKYPYYYMEYYYTKFIDGVKNAYNLPDDENMFLFNAKRFKIKHVIDSNYDQDELFPVCYAGLFAVKRDVILENSLDFYENIQDILLNDIRIDNRNKPIDTGLFLEKLWLVIFNYKKHNKNFLLVKDYPLLTYKLVPSKNSASLSFYNVFCQIYAEFSLDKHKFSFYISKSSIYLKSYGSASASGSYLVSYNPKFNDHKIQNILKDKSEFSLLVEFKEKSNTLYVFVNKHKFIKYTFTKKFHHLKDINIFNLVKYNFDPKQLPEPEPQMSKIKFGGEGDDSECNIHNYYTPKCNKILLKQEEKEYEGAEGKGTEGVELYPTLNDPNFVLKIAEKKEFNDYQYDGDIPDTLKEFKQHIDDLSKADFELSPHQTFVKNFMSFQTPYNSLLLYHGLGTGKTLSAIGIAEETRVYLKQMGINKRIIIVASENVQDNFRLQIFDERKLTYEDGAWKIPGYIGMKLLKEVDPMNMIGSGDDNKNKIVIKVRHIINTSYIFMGYLQLANYIIKIAKNIKKHDDKDDSKELLREKIEVNNSVVSRLRNEFNDRLIIIDEVHNINTDDNKKNKKASHNLELLVSIAQNMRLLFLSATPMFNSYREIIWLINIMNMNDQRGRITAGEIFDEDGKFKDGGEELLVRKINGYISYVRGENPYTFPYRVYPQVFDKAKTFPQVEYPEYQLNLKKIKPSDKRHILNLYLIETGEYQQKAYKYIMNSVRRNAEEMPNFRNMDKFGFIMLEVPIQALIFSYPHQELDDYKPIGDKFSEDFSEEYYTEESTKVEKASLSKPDIDLPPKELTGLCGLKRTMDFTCTSSKKSGFKYKDKTLDKYGPIFHPDNIGKYSSKMKNIVEQIREKAEGIVLIYSQYIDSGLIPMALALEELGLTRYGDGAAPLFKKPPTEIVDVRTMKPPTSKTDYKPARYIMITGDKKISPNNDFEVKGATDKNNVEGHQVKVILISQAGSEGIDFKYIRQVHILEPWYNMNRLEQVIGRAVRNFSHKDLPFDKRNVQIFMYASLLERNKEESADLYVYRTAEYKAVQIGRVTRILKENAVDCIVNQAQNNFTNKIIKEKIDEPILQILSDGQKIHNFKIGDMPFSPACDYMPVCTYECNPDVDINKIKVNQDTYSEELNLERIIQIIKNLMKERFFYKKKDFIERINIAKKYPLTQIYNAITQVMEGNIQDMYGREGKLENIGEYYLFQPIEIKNPIASIFQRERPLQYKHKSIKVNINDFKPSEEKKEVKYNSDVFKQLYEITQSKEPIKKEDITDDNKWYAYCLRLLADGYLEKVLNIKPKKDTDILNDFVVAHIIEFMCYKEKLAFINYIYSLDIVEEGSFEWRCKNYFINNTFSINNKTHLFILYCGEERKVYKLAADGNEWVKAKPTEVMELNKLPELNKAEIVFNSIVGFIGFVKNTLYFKTKNIEDRRNTGAVCHPKAKTIEVLDKILEGSNNQSLKFIKDNVKLFKDIELCIFLEFILRYYNYRENEGKTWFVTPETATYFKFHIVDKSPA